MSTRGHRTHLFPASALGCGIAIPSWANSAPRVRARHVTKVLGSVSAGRTDSTAIGNDATEYIMRLLQPATKYEIGVKSVRGREESEVASITTYTGGKGLPVAGSDQLGHVLSWGRAGSSYCFWQSDSQEQAEPNGFLR